MRAAATGGEVGVCAAGASAPGTVPDGAAAAVGGTGTCGSANAGDAVTTPWLTATVATTATNLRKANATPRGDE
jgi:hypothetical protein